MFASCYDVESGRPADYLDDDAPPNVYSVLANVRALGYNKNSNVNKRHSQDRVSYVCTPLLGALGDLMLAMLIKVSAFYRSSQVCLMTWCRFERSY